MHRNSSIPDSKSHANNANGMTGKHFLKTRLPRERALVQSNSHSDSSGSLRHDIDKRSAFTDTR